MDAKITAKKFLRSGFIAAALLGFSACAFASGFAVPFWSASDLGDAFAGGAAAALDASTAYNNPAGLTYLQRQQLVIAETGITTHTVFNGSATSPGLGAGGETAVSGKATSSFSGLIPAAYYAYPITDKLVAGFNMTAPYGLGNSYSDTGVTRYDLTYAKLIAVDIGPSVGYKITDDFSAGFGVDALYMGLKQKLMVRTQPYTPDDSLGQSELSGWGYGWHGGLLYQINPQTRVGLSYHSGIVDHTTGNSKAYVSSAGVLPAGRSVANNTQATFHLPPMTTLSVYRNLTPAWTLMGSVDYTQWSVFKNEHILNLATPVGPTTVNIPQNYRNTWHYALGTSYQLNSKWLLRTGMDYDQTATNDTDRTMQVPTGDRIGAGIGAHYQASKDIGIDAGYYHAFFKKQRINNVSPTGNTLTGTSVTVGDIAALQLNWNIG
jgi:long-chain fatty acid transport protein